MGLAPSGVALRVPAGSAAEGIRQVRVEPPAAPGHSPGCWRMEAVQRGSEPMSLGCVQLGSCPQPSAFPGMEWLMPSGRDATGVVVLQRKDASWKMGMQGTLLSALGSSPWLLA